MRTEETRAKALNQYTAIMQEVKDRVVAIESAMNGETKLPRMFAQEFCFLQLRMICELVALACVTAHGDLSAVARLKSQWSADTMLDSLERLDEYFFPWPSDHSRDLETKRFNVVDSQRPNCITKDELLKLYGTCGRRLHRGTHRNIFEVKRSRVVEFSEILEDCQRVLNLLSSHSIMMKRENKFYLLSCVLSGEPEGRVRAGIAAEIDPPPPPANP